MSEPVHNEDSLVKELFEAKLRLIDQRLVDHIRNSEKAAQHVAVELDRRLHETNGFKVEMSKQVSHFITRREALQLITLIAVVISTVISLFVAVLGSGINS